MKNSPKTKSYFMALFSVFGGFLILFLGFPNYVEIFGKALGTIATIINLVVFAGFMSKIEGEN